MTLDVYADLFDLFDDDFTAVADKLSETVGNLWARGVKCGGPANMKTAFTCADVLTVWVPSVRFELTLYGF